MANTNNLRIDVVIDHLCTLGEGPVWDARRKLICWVDILNGIIHQFSPAEKKHSLIDMHQMIGSFAVCTDGNFIAALQNGFAFVDSKTGEIKIIKDPESHLPGNRFNDGKCDPAGRFWAGTMALSEESGLGNVYTIHSDLASSKKIEGVSISNGMAWSADHKTFYYIDSPTFEIVAYDYSINTGHISNKRTIIKIPKEDGSPDGMTIDIDGMLWVAHWGGWQITRWDPEKAQKIYSIKLPVEKVTSCTFGGESFGDLYITSAKVGLSENELKRQPLAGSLFVVQKCGFKGMPAFEFRCQRNSKTFLSSIPEKIP